MFPDLTSGQMLPGAKGQQALEHLSHQRAESQHLPCAVRGKEHSAPSLLVPEPQWNQANQPLQCTLLSFQHS